jgi:hypothetical protein
VHQYRAYPDGEFGQLVATIGSGWEGFLQLIIRHPVIPTHSDAALADVNIFGRVGRGFADDVRAGGGGGFG